MDVPPTDVAGLEAWPALIPTLYQALDNQDNSLVDGALQVLVNIACQRHTLWGRPKSRLARLLQTHSATVSHVEYLWN